MTAAALHDERVSRDLGSSAGTPAPPPAQRVERPAWRDPRLWFGVLLVILIEVGLIHPPMGMNLFAINAVSKDIDILDIYKGSAPFLIAPLVLIVLMIAFPQIVLWLPAQLH